MKMTMKATRHTEEGESELCKWQNRSVPSYIEQPSGDAFSTPLRAL